MTAYERFTSTERALAHAYWCEAAEVRTKGFLTPSTGRGHGELDPQERLGDGIYIKNIALRGISDHKYRTALAVWYRLPGDRPGSWLSTNRHYDMRILMDYLLRDGCKLRDRRILRWAIREWSPVRRNGKELTLEWWSKQTGISIGTLKTWIQSKDPARKSVNYTLDGWLNIAHIQAADALKRSGRVD